MQIAINRALAHRHLSNQNKVTFFQKITEIILYAARIVPLLTLKKIDSLAAVLLAFNLSSSALRNRLAHL